MILYPLLEAAATIIHTLIGADKKEGQEMGTADGVEIFRNPKSSSLRTGPFPKRAALEFHTRLPGYQRTPLIPSPELASLLQVGEVWVKDESSRFGLPSFKILGASWAVYQALLRKLGHDTLWTTHDTLWTTHDTLWTTIEELKASFAPLHPLTLVAATDGNHGRAVAHVASWLGFEARIFYRLELPQPASKQ